MSTQLFDAAAIALAKEHGYSLHARDFSKHWTSPSVSGMVISMKTAEQMIAEGIEGGVWVWDDRISFVIVTYDHEKPVDRRQQLSGPVSDYLDVLKATMEDFPIGQGYHHWSRIGAPVTDHAELDRFPS